MIYWGTLGAPFASHTGEGPPCLCLHGESSGWGATIEEDESSLWTDGGTSRTDAPGLCDSFHPFSLALLITNSWTGMLLPHSSSDPSVHSSSLESLRSPSHFPHGKQFVPQRCPSQVAPCTTPALHAPIPPFAAQGLPCADAPAAHAGLLASALYIPVSVSSTLVTTKTSANFSFLYPIFLETS